MMKERRNQVLIAMAAVQLLLVLLVFWPRPARTAGEPLLPGLQSGDIVAFTVTDPGDKILTLRQVNGTWVLPDYEDYPVQASKVVLLLDQVTALTTGELVAQTAAGQKQLKVAADDFAHRLDLEKADGSHIVLYLGTSPRLNAVHVRVEGQDRTYLGSNLSTGSVDSRPISWVDPLYLNVATEGVTAFQVKNAYGLFAFSKDAEGTWSMAGLGPGETLDQYQVKTVLQQVASVRMLGPLGKENKPEYGMDRPVAVVTLQTSDRTITLTVGPANEADASHVVISSESPYYVRVSTSGLRDVVEKTRSGFLMPPPTATPTPALTATPVVSPTVELAVPGITGTAGITWTPGIATTPGPKP